MASKARLNESGDSILPKASQSTELGRCNVCHKPGRFACSSCQSVFYCSTAHQKKDSASHKEQCCPYVLTNSPEFGRHLTANRKLAAGTLVLLEEPLLRAPRGLVDDFETPICLTCCTLMADANAGYRCSKCSWPICSWACEQNHIHSDNECKIFSEKKVPFPPSEDYPVYIVYKVVEIMRGVLMKTENPEGWSKVANLQYKTELGNETELFKDLSTLRNSFGAENIGTDEDWVRVLGVLNVNNFSVEGQQTMAGPAFTGYVFLQSSMLAHSCAPNCWWGVSLFPDQKILVRTTVDVEKGEPLTVPYSFLYNAFGTHKRQELIRKDAEFVCKCRRCVDPSELGSYTSGIICQNCKAGTVLPINPLDLEGDWKCSSCGGTKRSEQILSLMEELMERLEGCQTVSAMRAFVAVNKSITLHANHWLITEAEDVMCQQWAKCLYEKDDLREDNRDAHIAWCEHLLKVKNLIAPGFSMERGRILNNLARARFEKLEETVKNTTPETYDRDEIWAEAELIFLLYDEALSFYKNDITEVPPNETYSLKCRMIMSDMKLVRSQYLNDDAAAEEEPPKP